MTMKLFVNLLFLFQYEVISVSARAEVCPPYSRLNALPGNGWCSLRNIEMNPVFSITYNDCEILETKNQNYLIPDNLHVIPQSTSDIDTMQEFIGHYQNFTSTTAASMSASASGTSGSWCAEASFSVDYQQMKKNQVINKSVTSRVSGRYVLHAARFDEYAVELHPDLKVRLLDAIEAITAGHLVKASLILELAILSYGTHVITGMDLGGVVVKEDYISEDYTMREDVTQLGLRASASIGFAQFFNAKSSYDIQDYASEYSGFVKNVKSTKISSHGGELFKSTLNISTWVDSLPNYLVAVDRSGLALPYVITPRHFPNVNQTILAALRREYVEAIEHFNAVNIHVGCMNQNSPNFDYNANIGDKSCQDPPTNYSLGGFFQTCYCYSTIECRCDKYIVKNYLTGDTTCPNMYTNVYLNGWSYRNCWQSWSWRYFCFVTECIDYEYKAFWCVANYHPIPNNTGLLFGGVFTSTATNPVTGSKSCPPNYFHVSILLDLKVCMSDVPEFGYKYSVPFGGFFSCHQGNPLASISLSNERNTTLKIAAAKSTCGDGYSQHLAAIDYDCLINYCVKANSFGSGQKDIPIELPPFQNYDEMFAEAAMTIDSIAPVTNLAIIMIILGILLGCAILPLVSFIALKKLRRNTFNDERSPLNGNNVQAGYESIPDDAENA